MRTTLPVFATLVALAGCGGSNAPPAAPTSPPAPSAAGSSSAAPVASNSGGTTAHPSAPAPDGLRAAAKAAIDTCKWEEGEPDFDCAAARTWQDLPAHRDGKSDEALVGLLGEADARYAWLAAKVLDVNGDKFRTDKAMAAKVLARLESALPPRALAQVASVAGAIDPEATGLGERLLKASEKLSVDARVSFLRAAQFRNSAFYYASTVALAKGEKDLQLREAAIRSFWVGTPSGKGAEVCELWTAVAEDDKTPDDLAGLSAGYAAWAPNDPCVKQFDRILARLEKRAKAGPLDSWDWPNAAEHLASNKAASATQKKKSVAWLKATAENPKNKPSVRATSTRALIHNDLGTAKAVLAKLQKDKDAELQQLTKSLEADLRDAEKQAQATKAGDDKKADPKKAEPAKTDAQQTDPKKTDAKKGAKGK